MTETTLLILGLKMVIAATIVVAASVIAERSRPFIAAMVATLPVSAGPAFAFLALDHDANFMQLTMIGAMVTNIATAAYSLAYVAAAREMRTLPSLIVAFLAWGFCGVALRQIGWSLPGAFAASLAAFAVAIPLARRFASNERATAPPRAWHAIPLRALAVATLVGLVTTLSWTLGPYNSGMLVAFPIVLTSIIVILQPRIGGRQTSAMIANGLIGLLGLGVALGIAAWATPLIGSFPALGVGLAICLIWNGAIVAWRALRPQFSSSSPRSL
ncbi:MAG TPA: hypothetical protein PKW21_08900 [Rhabdaerophilum sp.]|nr:hypothetical protein [Rhabdaerophilum sp.]